MGETGPRSESCSDIAYISLTASPPRSYVAKRPDNVPADTAICLHLRFSGLFPAALAPCRADDTLGTGVLLERSAAVAPGLPRHRQLYLHFLKSLMFYWLQIDSQTEQSPSLMSALLPGYSSTLLDLATGNVLTGISCHCFSHLVKGSIFSIFRGLFGSVLIERLLCLTLLRDHLIDNGIDFL